MDSVVNESQVDGEALRWIDMGMSETFGEMASNSEITLLRDTAATIIPAGDEHILKAGTRVSISQALGGTVTVRSDAGLFRINGKDWDALGQDVRADLEASASAASEERPSVPFGEDAIWEAMKGVFDPEIPVNIVDLGLIYDLKISPADAAGKHSVNVKMTLTAQGCGMGPVIAGDARKEIEALELCPMRRSISWTCLDSHISDEGRQSFIESHCCVKCPGGSQIQTLLTRARALPRLRGLLSLSAPSCEDPLCLWAQRSFVYD